MAQALPIFEKFLVHSDQATAGTRFKKWLARFELLITGMNITGNNAHTRKRALLLHYAGEEVFDIYETFSNEKKGDDTAAGYETLKASLTEYFEPHKNIDYETYRFRQSKQRDSETIDEFCTRLRQLSVTCEFHDKNREIKNQILMGCKSGQLRRKALRDDMDLDNLLKAARTLELASSHAQEIEQSQNSSKFEKSHKISTSSHKKIVKKGESSKNPCSYCGFDLHPRNKCPARDKKCNFCDKVGHFSSVCRKKKGQKVDLSNKPRGHGQRRGNHSWRGRHSSVRQISGISECFDVQEDTLSDSDYDDEGYIFVTSSNHDTPMIDLHFDSGDDIQFFIDTGASVNIVDENTFQNMNIQRPLSPSKTKIFAYGKTSPLKTVGQFSSIIRYNSNSLKAVFHVVKTENGSKTGNLLSAKTAQDLQLIHFAFSASSNSNKSVAEVLCNDNPQIFDKIGKHSDVAVKLHIDESVQPKIQPHRRIPFHLRKKVETELKNLEKLDIIEKVSGPTPWVSPIVITPKKNNDIRICVDMRLPNQAIKRTRHYMPTIDDIMSRLNGATVFTKLDLNKGYHQLELSEESRNITTFTTHVGLRRYKRLNFGVASAAEIFQNVISETISDIPNCLNTSDDILIYGVSQADHDQTLKQVFDRLKSKNLTLNKEKCEFNKDRIEFYGFIFSRGGVSPDPKKVSALKNATAPSNVKELRSFLGLTNYVSRFIPNYSDLTKPLRDLTKKQSEWVWSSKCDKAFNVLKNYLSDDKTLHYFDPKLHTSVFVDASPFGLGGILCQKNNSGHLVTIAYASRSLTDVESRYSQTEREALAVVWACEHFHLYLFGENFDVITDHKPLETIFNNPTSRPSSRLERWNLRLQSYQFRVKFQPGSENPADYLSRHAFEKSAKPNSDTSKVAEDYVNFLTNHAVPKAMTLDQISYYTKIDPTLIAVKQAISSNAWNKIDNNIDNSAFQVFKTIRDDLSYNEQHGIILKCNLIVIPYHLQKQVLDIAHEGHQGMVKTKQLMREKVWFPYMDTKVESMIKSCLPCMSATPETKREPPNMTELPDRPWSELHADFAGPLPCGSYLLIVVDSFSRYPEVEIVHSTSARAVIPKFDSIFARHGICDVLKTDNGPPFSGHEFKMFAQSYGFIHKKITPRWPQANGLAEKFVSTIKKSLRTSPSNWRQDMYTFLRNYRATPHCTTKKSPAELLFNRKIKTKMPFVGEKVENPKLRQQDASQKQKMRDYVVHKYHYCKPSKLKIGDTVLVKNENSKTFHDYPLTVTQIKGSMITASNQSKNITRNNTFFKKFEVTSNPDAKIEKSDKTNTHAKMERSDKTKTYSESDHSKSSQTNRHESSLSNDSQLTVNLEPKTFAPRRSPRIAAKYSAQTN